MKIYCKGCKIYLGEIRDAKLRKHTVFLCDKCEIKRYASDLAEKTKKKNPLEDLFRGIT